MKTKMNILPTIATAMILGAMLAACSGRQKKPLPPDLPEEVRPAAQAIVSDSPSEFAAAVAYPLARPYPLKDISDSTEMVKYYSTLVDDTLKKTVAEAPDSAWQEMGWRGWTLYNGTYFWIDSGKIYAVDYLSPREAEILDSLRHEEIATLEPSLQTGWTPVLCVIDSDDGAIFRIDSKNDSVTSPDTLVYRLAGYSADIDLSGRPAIILYGNLDMEGSMGNRFYHFSDSTGTTADYSPDICGDSDTIPALEVGKGGKLKKYHARPGYWLDQVNKRRHSDDIMHSKH